MRWLRPQVGAKGHENSCRRNEPMHLLLRSARMTALRMGWMSSAAHFPHNSLSKTSQEDKPELKYVAKCSSSADTYSVVKGAFVAVRLARLCGLNVAPVDLTQSLGKDGLIDAASHSEAPRIMVTDERPHREADAQ